MVKKMAYVTSLLPGHHAAFSVFFFILKKG